MATSERTKKKITDLKKAVQKAHGLENELKKARIDLADAPQLDQDCYLAEEQGFARYGRATKGGL